MKMTNHPDRSKPDAKTGADRIPLVTDGELAAFTRYALNAPGGVDYARELLKSRNVERVSKLTQLERAGFVAALGKITEIPDGTPDHAANIGRIVFALATHDPGDWGDCSINDPIVSIIDEGGSAHGFVQALARMDAETARGICEQISVEDDA
jgi:hypothetical protein